MDSSSGQLRIWEGWAPPVAQGPGRPLMAPRAIPGPHWPASFADRLAAREMLRAPSRGLEGTEPLSLEWFLNVESARFGRQGHWLPRYLEFSKHRGERLLGLGLGLGTDWVQYARHGAEVVACCPMADHLALVRRNFELRGLTASAYLHASPQALPLETASIDVTCITGVLHEVADPAAVVEEVYRVLKPGGKVLALAPSRFDVEFWRRCLLPLLPRLRSPHPLSSAEPEPLPSSVMAKFSARSLRRLFARFIEPHVHKRHLRRGDVPHLWRWVPLSLLERCMGRLLVVKAFKPLSAAMPGQMAA